MKRKELAYAFSTSESSLKKWTQEGFPIKGDLRGQIKWVRENRPLVSRGITDARTRKITAEARLKELDLMIREGELLPRGEIAQHNAQIIQQTKQRLLLLRRTLPPKLVGLEIRQMPDVIKREIRQILENFYRGIKRG
jgi:hypothetical protein